MAQIRTVDAVESIQKYRDLMLENWRETGFKFEFNPSLEMARAMQDNGIMFALGAFDGDEMVGYSTAMVAPHWFNPAEVWCMSDALFVKREYRQGLTGGKLILATEAEAKKRGATAMLWHTRSGTSLSDAFEMRGYKPADLVMMKGL